MTTRLQIATDAFKNQHTRFIFILNISKPTPIISKRSLPGYRQSTTVSYKYTYDESEMHRFEAMLAEAQKGLVRDGVCCWCRTDVRGKPVHSCYDAYGILAASLKERDAALNVAREALTAICSTTCSSEGTGSYVHSEVGMAAIAHQALAAMGGGK